MNISDQRLEVLRNAYKKDFSEAITLEEARAIAHRLLELAFALRQHASGRQHQEQPLASGE